MNYYIIASLAFFLAGLVFFIKSILSKKIGISKEEFISSNYLLVKVPFSQFKSKRLLLRRLTVADVLDIDNIPNWLHAMLVSDKPKDVENERIAELSEKTELELAKETKDYFDLLQKVAEKSIVQWESYVAEWKQIDPEYTGRLPDISLQFIFNEILNPKKISIKKKSSYYVLRLLQTLSKKPQVST